MKATDERHYIDDQMATTVYDAVDLTQLIGQCGLSLKHPGCVSGRGRDLAAAAGGELWLSLAGGLVHQVISPALGRAWKAAGAIPC